MIAASAVLMAAGVPLVANGAALGPGGVLTSATRRCDRMAQLAGMESEERLAGWDGSPLTSDSESHIAIWGTT